MPMCQCPCRDEDANKDLPTIPPPELATTVRPQKQQEEHQGSEPEEDTSKPVPDEEKDQDQATTVTEKQ